jgi:hypothetical protein
MYATCLFCNKPLGRNESLESFPVGRRLAFDAAKGRLWVVCQHCERWNLSPLEERWEAIEQAEKLYRDTRRRVSTDNIGLAKLREGTTLVRIGEPLRPEFAAWRYGDQFGRRRRRQLLVTGGSLAAIGAIVVGGIGAGVGIGGFGWLIAQAGSNLVRGNPEEVVAKIRSERYGLMQVRRRHLAETSLSFADDGSLAIDLRFKGPRTAHFEGSEAHRIASIVVPKANRFGGNRQTIADAIGHIDDHGGSEAFLAHMAKTARQLAPPIETKRQRRWGAYQWRRIHQHGLLGLPGTQRLALEMALHEEAERRAMLGELEELERAWRDAEEIAFISDNLLVPESVDSTFKKLKDGG